MLSIFSTSLFAQFKVDGYGRVGIGVGQLYTDYAATIVHDLDDNGLAILNQSSSTKDNIGIQIDNYFSSSSNKTYGIKINPVTPYSYFSNGFAYGVFATGRGSNSCDYGIAGALDSGALHAAAIYGSAISHTPFDRTGKFAGYFYGNVVVTGNLYGTLYSQINSSPNRSVRIPLSTDNTSVECISEKLAKLEPVQVINTRSQEEFNKKNEDSLKIEVYIPNYSIEEEGLKEAFPELINEDADGNISVNYVEMVPLLVQSIKELKAEIEELKGNDVKKTASRNTMATSIEGTDVEAYTLYQNEPNPFKEATTVKLTIPKKAQDAALIIYDMSGKQLKQININGRGKTSVKITSEGLGAGMYLYSLIADGKMINTKRMILTK